jgi:hypothetical protein
MSNRFSFGQDRSVSTTLLREMHAKSPQQGGGFARGLQASPVSPKMPPTARGWTMEPNADLTNIPGRRIGGYRNSSRRHIKLYGLGETGAAVARGVGARGLANVEVRTGTRAAGWAEITGSAASTRDTNMVVIVCGEGDEALFRPERGRPASLVTFVLLQQHGNLLVVREESIAGARGSADLFVTTSDRDYVADLIDNLAS